MDRSNASERGVCSGSTLFALRTGIFYTNHSNKNYTRQTFSWIKVLSLKINHAVCIQNVYKKTDITKTGLYNFDPLKPHFYIVKLGFTGIYIIFLISAQNIDCGYPLEPPRLVEAVLTSTHNLCFEQKYE